MSTCDDLGRQEICKAVRREQKLNRIVIAAGSPRMHEPTFRRTVSRPYFQAMLLSTASPKRKEAVEKRMIMVIEDVVE